MRSAVILCAAALACGDNHVGSPRIVPPSPSLGVDDPGLAALLDQQWDLEATYDPLTASYYGDARYDAILPPVTHAEVEALRARRHALRDTVAAFDPSHLSDRDRVSYGVLLERLTVAVGLEVCDYERWAVANGLASQLADLGSYHPLWTAENAASYLARVEAMPAAIDAYTAELQAGAAIGETERKPALVGELGAILAVGGQPPAGWALVRHIDDATIGDAARDQLVDQVSAVIANELAPAYLRLGATIQREIVPVAREVEGLAGLPMGRDCYAAEIRRHTSLPLTAAELHELGLAEVARIRAATEALGAEVYHTTSYAQVANALYSDRTQGFSSEDDLLGWVRMIIDRAQREVEPLFARLPSMGIELVPYDDSLGQISASYQQSLDGIEDGRYYLVTKPVTSQSKWNLEGTTYHETIPGHHLQLGRAAMLADLPAVRWIADDTAFIEGWGLYAETLADEIGLYTSGPARLGRLANEQLRACRLVVDTGLHDLGWTRAQAEAFMQDNLFYGAEYDHNEVERYIRGPGQALAYKVGERELLRLREVARARDGAAFSLRDFHEAVLAVGSMPLPVLAARVAGPPPAQLRIRPEVSPFAQLLSRRPPPPARGSLFRRGEP
jgi:uncharacterized protein (DUF885 family)